MKNIFLNLKHWKIFTLVYILPILIFVLFFSLNRYLEVKDLGNNMMYAYIYMIMIPYFLHLTIKYLWILSIFKKYIHKFTPEEEVIWKFKSNFNSLIITSIYTLSVLCYEFRTDGLLKQGGELDNIFTFLIFISFLISVYNRIYITYNISKMINELNNNYFNSTICFLLSTLNFIGIWIFQPKLNKIEKTITNTV